MKITISRADLSSKKGVLDTNIPLGIYPNDKATSTQLNEHISNIIRRKYITGDEDENINE